MQGLYVRPIGDPYQWRRPKSKKEVRDLVKSDYLDRVRIEATSIFSDEYDGLLINAPAGTITFCGPDPYTRRSFYGNIEVRIDGTAKVT